MNQVLAVDIFNTSTYLIENTVNFVFVAFGIYPEPIP